MKPFLSVMHAKAHTGKCEVQCASLHHKMFFRNITLQHQKKRASFLSLNTGVSEKVVHISEIL